MDYVLKITYFFRTWCSSRKYPHPNGGQQKFRGDEGCPKVCNFRGGQGAFCMGSLCETGELSKINTCSVEQAVSHFAVLFIKGRLNFLSRLMQ